MWTVVWHFLDDMEAISTVTEILTLLFWRPHKQMEAGIPWMTTQWNQINNKWLFLFKLKFDSQIENKLCFGDLLKIFTKNFIYLFIYFLFVLLTHKFSDIEFKKL